TFEGGCMRTLWLTAALCALSAPISADEPRFAAGARLLILLSDGQPANDMIGLGLTGRWRWREGWYLGFGLDQVEFDYERPNDILGIPSTAEIDGSNDWTRVSGWIERRYDEGDLAWSWHWLAGLGFASVSTEDVRGATPTGGTWDIATDARNEVHALLGIGLRRYIGARWAVDGALHVEHHATDYELVDRVSGRTGTVSSQTPWGASFGVSYRF
ncbi:MAG: hypothetical protein ACRETX_07160, partial [Steroidobacteraceae bacterium]